MSSDISRATSTLDADVTDHTALAEPKPISREWRATRPGRDRVSVSLPAGRPEVRGKFLWVEGRKFYVRGVTYGPFRPGADGSEYHTPDRVERDFATMIEAGVNAVRTYTVPPTWLLDLALEQGLRVMVGLPWEQHIAFLDEAGRPEAIESRVRTGVSACARHPAILAYAVGNEIPASIVRWHGHRAVERFLERLCRAVREEDPGALVTYVNYPTTEYLRLPFVDFVSFNVYLESREKLEGYLARLHNLAGNRPLLMAEMGLDSRRNGEDTQARTLAWQIESAFAGGCAGTFLFAWTDEWHRGGHDIDDWDFGLTTRQRQPKPALAAVQATFARTPFASGPEWPQVSVVVCSHNGARTLVPCGQALQDLAYPNYEVIVVDDGSSDNTASIADSFGFRVIRTENRGLSNARNTGLAASQGEIVAYTDDDAQPDPHWLHYLVLGFQKSNHVGIGGPNVAPADNGEVAACVANAPGGPIHVLLSDSEAEHIPGCNMAFRREALEAIGGFDPQFRIAGDDVDLCWRLQEQGWTLGFHPAAFVWHRRRNSIAGYWRQQKNYGAAEAMLEKKWPEKYNRMGHLTWFGRLYEGGFAQALPLRRQRIYQGVWGTRLFQSVYEPVDAGWWSLPLMPEWHLVGAALLLLSLLGLVWNPLLLAAPLWGMTLLATLTYSVQGARRAQLDSNEKGARFQLKLRGLTALLYLLQPVARLWGRLGMGLSPWRRSSRGWHWPGLRSYEQWSETWRGVETRLTALEEGLSREGAIVERGGDFDHWDLAVRGGLLGGVRLRMGIEEHGGGRQMVRVRVWPHVPAAAVALGLLPGLLALAAGLSAAHLVALVLAALAAAVGLWTVGDCGAAMAAHERAWTRQPPSGDA